MVSRDIFPVQVNEVQPLDYCKNHWIYNLPRVRAFISHMLDCGRIYHMELPDTWRERNLDHIHFCLKEMQNENELGPMLFWDKIARRLKRDPKRDLHNADTRLLFRLDNMFLVKHGFTFGNWIVDPGHQHVIQTSCAPMFCYELPQTSTLSQDVKMRRRLPEAYQMVYDRYILPPHGKYCVPEGTHYVLMAVQKTIFSMDVVEKDQVVPGIQSFKSFRKYKKRQEEAPVKRRPLKRKLPSLKIEKKNPNPFEKKRSPFLDTPKKSPPSRPTKSSPRINEKTSSESEPETIEAIKAYLLAWPNDKDTVPSDQVLDLSTKHMQL